MVSAAFGIEPKDTCKRCCKKGNTYLDVPRPSVVKQYNEKMGRADLADRMLSSYSQTSRTNRWMMRTVLHMTDLACVNSWIQNRSDKLPQGLPKRSVVDYLDFMLCIAETVIYEKATDFAFNDENGAHVVARKRTKELPPEGFRKKYALYLPLKYDLQNAARCRKPGCNTKTRHRSSRCDVYLFIEIGRNCLF